MASCAVKWCGKSAKNSNYQKDGITFHRFPKCPEMKKMWIDATCRGDEWFPTKNSVLCSRHFTEDNLHIMKNRRRLLDSAIPSLYLPVLAPVPTIGASADIAAKNMGIPVAGTSLQNADEKKHNIEEANIVQDVQNNHPVEHINIGEDNAGTSNTVRSNPEVESFSYVMLSQQEFTDQECSSPEQRPVVTTSGKRQRSLSEHEQQLNEEDDECYIFGRLVAKKLRKLPDSRRDLLMIKINQLIYAESYGLDRPHSPLSRSSCSYTKSPQTSIQKEEFITETSSAEPTAIIKLEYDYE